MKRRNSKNLIIIVVLIVLSLFPLLAYSSTGKDTLVLISFYFNALICIIGILQIQKEYPFSIEMMIWVFLFLFMFLAPTIQYLTNTYPWKGNLKEEEILITNFIITLFIMSFILGKVFGRRIKIRLKSDSIKNGQSFLTRKFDFFNFSSLIFMVVCMVLALYSISRTGLLGIVVSRSETIDVFYSGNNSAIKLIVGSVIPAFMTYCTVESAQKIKYNRIYIIIFIIDFLCLLICYFPTTIARYKMAAIYLTILIVLFPSIRKNNRFLVLFIFSLILIFPILGILRNGFVYAIDYDFIVDSIKESYTGGDFDAYRMLVSSLRYVREYGSTMGKQLVGVLFFFIPSSLWSGKPLGSGDKLIKAELGSNVFSNVSCPYIGEGLINFGVFGVVFFAFLLGIICVKSDSKYWSDGNNSNVKFSPYLLLMFMMFFIMRGDLLSSFSFTMGFLVTGFVLSLFTKKQTNNDFGDN